MATIRRNVAPKKLIESIWASANKDALLPQEVEHVRNCERIIKEMRELLPNDQRRLEDIAAVICWT